MDMHMLMACKKWLKEWVDFIVKSIHRLTVNFFTSRHLIGRLKQELKAGDLRVGIRFLKRKYFLFKPRSVRFLIRFYKYLLATDNAVSFESKDKKTIIVHFCCWGQRYSQKAISYLLPSLLAKGNFPAISQKYNIVLLIHCDLAMRLTLESGVLKQRIEKYATLKMVVLPESLLTAYNSLTSYHNISFLKEVNAINRGLRYLFLGGLQAQALRAGIANTSLVSFLMPDSILSDRFLSYAVDKIRGKKLVLTTTFRSDYPKLRPHLDRFYVGEDKTEYAISGAQLAQFQVQYLHDTDRRRVISETTNHFLASARFIFKSKEGFVLRALHYHPVLMDCSKIKNDLKVDWFPIDDAVLKQVLVDPAFYEDQVWMCSDPSQMNFMELSDDNPEVNEPPVYVAPSTFESLVNSVYLLLKACPKDLDEAMNRFFIRNELRFSGEEQCHAEHEIIDGSAFLAALYHRIDQVG